jgi:hypothetical protein
MLTSERSRIGKTQCPDGKRIATRFDINYKAAIGKRYIFFESKSKTKFQIKKKKHPSYVNRLLIQGYSK